MHGPGGRNNGCWSMHSGSQELILKLVKASHHEGEQLLDLARRFPAIVHDPTISFPSHVFRCVDCSGAHRFDLIVMVRAAGVSLAEFICEAWYAKRVPQLMRVLEKLGSQLHEFHMRYCNSQHGDFHVSNIFYDKATDTITFIDIADVGSASSNLNPDKQHFLKSLQAICQSYGATFLAEASGAFELGYRSKAREPYLMS